MIRSFFTVLALLLWTVPVMAQTCRSSSCYGAQYGTTQVTFTVIQTQTVNASPARACASSTGCSTMRVASCSNNAGCSVAVAAACSTSTGKGCRTSRRANGERGNGDPPNTGSSAQCAARASAAAGLSEERRAAAENLIAPFQARNLFWSFRHERYL